MVSGLNSVKGVIWEIIHGTTIGTSVLTGRHVKVSLEMRRSGIPLGLWL